MARFAVDVGDFGYFVGRGAAAHGGVALDFAVADVGDDGGVGPVVAAVFAQVFDVAVLSFAVFHLPPQIGEGGFGHVVVE